MTKAEIHSKAEIAHDLGYPEFVSAHITDPDTVYVPIGELYGVKILAKYKVKKEGMYLILE